MSTPHVIQDAVLREVIARSIAKREAAKVRAWKRRHGSPLVRRLTRVLIPLAFVAWALTAFIALAAAFDL